MEHSEVFVIGAGPAGLTAAYLLTKAGVATTVIEADPVYVGGISRTVNYKDFLFDIGGHRFFSKSKEVVDLWHEILPDDFIERPRLSRIYYDGKHYSYPLKAFEALSNLGVVESTMCVLSYAYKKAFPNANPENFREWVSNQFGDRLFSIFFKTYTEKVWGMSCEEISADWAAQRIKGLDLWSAMANALRRSIGTSAGPQESDKVIKTLIESFQYPRKGPGMMWDAAAAKVKAQGGAIHMGCKLESLSWDEKSGVWTITASTAQGPRFFTARHVISSAPIRELMASIEPAPQSLAAAEKLRYRDFITVALIVDKPDLFPDNWIYIHEPNVLVGRIQNFRSWSPEMVPDEKLPASGSNISASRATGCGPLRTPSSSRSPSASSRLSGSRARTTSRTAASCARRRRTRSMTTSTRCTSIRSARTSRRIIRRCISSVATACTSTTTRTTR